MVTVAAVMGRPNACLLDEELELGFPNAEIHDPTVTSAAEAEIVCWNAVLEV
jgi:hypothetical protein